MAPDNVPCSAGQNGSAPESRWGAEIDTQEEQMEENSEALFRYRLRKMFAALGCDPDKPAHVEMMEDILGLSRDELHDILHAEPLNHEKVFDPAKKAGMMENASGISQFYFLLKGMPSLSSLPEGFNREWLEQKRRHKLSPQKPTFAWPKSTQANAPQAGALERAEIEGLAEQLLADLTIGTSGAWRLKAGTLLFIHYCQVNGERDVLTHLQEAQPKEAWTAAKLQQLKAGELPLTIPLVVEISAMVPREAFAPGKKSRMGVFQSVLNAAKDQDTLSVRLKQSGLPAPPGKPGHSKKTTPAPNAAASGVPEQPPQEATDASSPDLAAALRAELQKALAAQRKLPKPADAEPADAEPADAEPADAEPADAEPADAEPADAEPADAEPADAEPADAEPADAEPADAEPADAEPADAEPADAEPADAEPADAEPAVTGSDDDDVDVNPNSPPVQPEEELDLAIDLVPEVSNPLIELLKQLDGLTPEEQLQLIEQWKTPTSPEPVAVSPALLLLAWQHVQQQQPQPVTLSPALIGAAWHWVQQREPAALVEEPIQPVPDKGGAEEEPVVSTPPADDLPVASDEALALAEAAVRVLTEASKTERDDWLFNMNARISGALAYPQTFKAAFEKLKEDRVDTTLSQVSCRSKPTPETIVALAAYLGKEVKELLPGTLHKQAQKLLV